MKYEKTTKNSLGQFLKSRWKWFWVSNWIVPPKKVTDKKTGVVVTVPASITKKGLTYTKE
jgi:hypothetical protein